MNRPLPLPTQPPRRARGTVYALSAVDGSGRIGDRQAIRAIGWSAGARVELRPEAGRIPALAAPSGRAQLTEHGRLRLPASLRRRYGIQAGDRVLLAAEPTTGVLAVHPLAGLDAILDKLSEGAT